MEKIELWLHMEKLVKEYIAFLDSDSPASIKFWDLEKKTKQDKKKPGVIPELNKRDMLFDIIRLINDSVITMDDLSDFTNELRENVKVLQERMNYETTATDENINPLFTWTANWTKVWENKRTEDLLVLVNNATRFTVAMYQVKRKDLKGIRSLL